MRCLSGSVAVSAYELESLPLPSAKVLRDWNTLTGTALEAAVASGHALWPARGARLCSTLDVLRSKRETFPASIDGAAVGRRTAGQQTRPAALRRGGVRILDPRLPGVRALTGQSPGTMRLRIGDCRVVYVVQDDLVLGTVIRVAHRREVCRDL